jgi:hypothetical protein
MLQTCVFCTLIVALWLVVAAGAIAKLPGEFRFGPVQWQGEGCVQELEREEVEMGEPEDGLRPL